MQCDYYGAPLTLPMWWRGRMYSMAVRNGYVTKHECLEDSPPQPNERWWASQKEGGVQGECEMCGKETTISWAMGYYDENKNYVKDPAGLAMWLCAHCHHGGPKKTVATTKVEQIPDGMLVVEDE